DRAALGFLLDAEDQGLATCRGAQHGVGKAAQQPFGQFRIERTTRRGAYGVEMQADFLACGPILQPFEETRKEILKIRALARPRPRRLQVGGEIQVFGRLEQGSGIGDNLGRAFAVAAVCRAEILPVYDLCEANDGVQGSLDLVDHFAERIVVRGARRRRRPRPFIDDVLAAGYTPISYEAAIARRECRYTVD